MRFLRADGRGEPRLAMVVIAALAFASLAGCKGPAGDAATSTILTLERRVEAAVGDADFATARSGDAVRPGDRVRTDATGFAELNWPDGSLTRLGPDTTIRVSNLTRPDRRQVHLRLDVGQTWHRVERITGSASYEVATPVGTAAVRGTQFAITCSPQGSCSFQVVDGTIVLTLATGGSPILITAGQSFTTDGTTRAGPDTVGVSTLESDTWIARNQRLDALPVDQRAATLQATTTTSAATSGGRVLFARHATDNPNGDADLFVLEADGGVRRLTNIGNADDGPAGFGVISGEWSPDGKRVAAIRQSGSSTSLFVIDTEPPVPVSDVRDIGGTGHDQSPQWSPDGSNLVFVAPGQGVDAVVLVRPDGSGRRVVPNTVDVAEATFTPDGSRLLVALTDPQEGSGFVRRVGTIAFDGTDYRELMSAEQLADRPHGFRYSPDGRSLAMTSGGSACSGDVYVVRVDNPSAPAPLRIPGRAGRCAVAASPPSWSSDSTHIVVAVEDLADGVASGVFAVRADGTGFTRLTNPRPNETPMDSAPDLFGSVIPVERASSSGPTGN